MYFYYKLHCRNLHNIYIFKNGLKMSLPVLNLIKMIKFTLSYLNDILGS